LGLPWEKIFVKYFTKKVLTPAGPGWYTPGRLLDLDKIFYRAHPHTRNFGYFQAPKQKQALTKQPKLKYNYSYDKFGGGQGHERSVTFFGIAAAMAMQWS